MEKKIERQRYRDTEKQRNRDRSEQGWTAREPQEQLDFDQIIFSLVEIIIFLKTFKTSFGFSFQKIVGKKDKKDLFN